LRSRKAGDAACGGGHWTRKHRLWLSAQRFDDPARQIGFEELVQAVDEAQARRDRLAKQMQELLPSRSLANVVTAIDAVRGVARIAATTLVAEIGDFHRFANPRQLMAYLGLAPSERSSGAKTWRGEIANKPETPAPGGSSSKAPGLIDRQRGWALKSPSRTKPCRKPSRTSHGRPRSRYAPGIAGS
jgi:transposase